MFDDVKTIFKKEFSSYFKSRLAYFILTIYIITSMACTFYLGKFFNIVNYNLYSFFYYQPGVLISLIPALTMKLWADERRYGTIELLLTQPLRYSSIVLGKFFAAWAFCGLMLLLTIPFWISTAWIIPIDSYNVFYNYFAVFVLSGALCAIGCVVSALSSNPISAYILTVFIGTLLKMVNFDLLIKKLKISNEIVIRISQSLNFDSHYESIILGQLTWSDFIYFSLLIIFCLWLNCAAVEYKRD